MPFFRRKIINLLSP